MGKIEPEAERLIDVTETSLAAGIAAMVVATASATSAHAVQEVVEAAGLSVVREYTGHGIGQAMHEPPDVPNYGGPGKGSTPRAGQTLAVEPMVTSGRPRPPARRRLDRRHRRRLAGRPTGEHTMAITDDGPEILTLP